MGCKASGCLIKISFIRCSLELIMQECFNLISTWRNFNDQTLNHFNSQLNTHVPILLN